MAGAGPAPAGKRGPLVPILAVLSALLFLGTAVTTVLYASEYSAHNQAKRTISQRDATLVARAAELEKTRGDLQRAQEELGKTKTDLTGSKNQADELKRQKQVIAKCFNLLGEVVTAASNGDRATVAKKQPELDAACNEAEKYTH
jgi:ABC-type transport system involved in cytochrome bd biosynthesis fused ATPase/permease subunit